MDVRPGVPHPEPTHDPPTEADGGRKDAAPAGGRVARTTSRAVRGAGIAVGVLVVAGLVVLLAWQEGDHGSSGSGGAVPAPADNAHPFFGVDLPSDDEAQIAKFSSDVGCAPRVQNAFVKLDSTSFDQALLDRLGSHGREPMITLEPWSWRSKPEDTDLPAYSLKTVAAGEHDDDFRRIAHVLSSYPGPVMVRFAHEMDANWYPWAVGVNGNSASDYVDAWRHVHDLMTGIDPRLKWVWASASEPTGDDPPSLDEIYPGDDQVDYVGVSGYGHSDEDGSRTATETYGEWYDEVRKVTDKPAILSEMGADGSAKDDWIASLPAFMNKRPGIVGFVWYNTTPESTGATGDYRVDDSQDHLDAFKKALEEMKVSCL